MKISPEILTIHSESTGFRPDTLEKVAHLLNLLGAIQENGITEEFGRELIEGCRNILSKLLPFTDGEKKFLDLLLDKGEIDPTCLTDDTSLQDRIRKQLLLEWKAINVRQHKGFP